MFQGGKIKVRDMKELQSNDLSQSKPSLTPLRKHKNFKSASTCKKKFKECNNDTVSDSNNATTSTTITKSSKKRLLKSALKETPSNQKRIDSYFSSCPKNYEIKIPKEQLITTLAKTRGLRNTSATKKRKKAPARTNSRRKRLYTTSTEPSTENMSNTSYVENPKKQNVIECITIDSDSEEENNVKSEIGNANNEIASTSKMVYSADKSDCKRSTISSSPITASSLSFGQRRSKTSCENSINNAASSTSGRVSRRNTKPCPPYKVIENTTFAVDAFQFGYIENVTHYFLTHFHADHYIGLTKSFSMPLFVSPITARLLHAFIPIQEQYIHELDLNESCIINNIEITALDANHCPGSVMFLFKFLDTGKCILHTGDFRACHDMESESIYWNNSIHTIYLDTTYISDKYAFCTQYESIEKARNLIDKFLEKHSWHRVLYICGSYIIGKERFWSSLANEYNMKVWTEGNRYKALKAMNDEQYNRLLVDDPNEANMHILPMGKVSYLQLVEYFKLYEDKYDVLFAIRPSGWEKDTKPRYGSKINLVGVEYSEHSSYEEMKRFVKFLKPEQVISTVPTGKDLMKTSNVPHSWYKYDKLKVSSNYQPAIDSFINTITPKNLSIRLPNVNKGGLEYFVSPLKHITSKNNAITPPQIHENKAELCRDIVHEQTQNGETSKKTKMKSFAISISNSSDDFERTDFIIKSQPVTRNKKGFKENGNRNSLTQTKANSNNKQITPNNNNVQAVKINSAEMFETASNDLKTKNKSDNGFNDFERNIPASANLNEQNSFNSATQQRKTRSQSRNSSKTTTKTKQTEEKLSTKSTSSHTTTPFELELPSTAKRMTRSKTNSTKTGITFNSENNNEFNFESQLLKTTEQQITQTPATVDRNIYQVNPILKSTTNSSLDQTSNNGRLCDISTIINNKINSLANDDNRLEEFEELPTNSSRSKRSASNHKTTPFKKSKPSLYTQTILNSILEQGEKIDRFNCSQLASIVVATVNEQNPDNSKDHIPFDLLSDAEDDWM